MAMTDEERKRRHRESERKRREYRREHHLYLACGKPLPDWDEKHTRCEGCRAEEALRRRKRRIARKYDRIYSDSMVHGDSALTKEVRRLMAKYPDMPPTAYGRMKAREYWEAQGVKTHDNRI